MLNMVILSLALFGNSAFCSDSPQNSSKDYNPPPSSLTLSIRDAVQHALAKNPDVSNDQERLTEADANKSFAIAQLFPVITGIGSAYVEKDPVNTGNAAFGGDPYNKYVAQLKLMQPLYQGGALLAGLNYANKDKEIREYELEMEVRDLTVQVIQAFYAVFSNKKVISILRETQNVEKESLATAQRYYKIGRGQLIDVLQIKAQIALLNPQIVTAENQMKAAVSQLATLLHENQASMMNLIGSLAVVEPDIVRALLPSRKKLPEITRGETLISQFQDKEEVTLSTYNPMLNIQGTLGQSSTTKSELFDSSSNGWTIGLYLTIPIFNGLASIDQRHALNSQSAQLEYTQQKLLDTLSYNQTQSERDLSTAATVLAGSKEAAGYAKDSLKEAQRDFKFQTISYLQLLTSQQSDLSAQLAYIQAKGGYISALAAYCSASGIPIGKLVDLLESKKDAPDDQQ